MLDFGPLCRPVRGVDSLDAFARAKLDALDAADLRRRVEPTERLGGVRVRRAGREFISFSCNDYLGLAHHPQVKAAAADAVQRYGAGAGASRLVTGDHPLLGTLEARLARRKGSEAALVFGSGYLANLAITPALAGPGDLVLLDALSHACMRAGAQLSGARVETFRHNDLRDLAGRLAALRPGAGRAMILTERVFSMDGDRAPTAELARLAQVHDAWLLVDDAHGLGVVDDPVRAPLEMGTLSKSLGSYGGYVCASATAVELLKSRARPFVYTTGLPPSAAAGALAALDVLEAEPARARRPRPLARRRTGARGLAPAPRAVVPLVVGSAGRALAMSQALSAQGLLVVAIRPPTVPDGQARLRMTLSAAHTEAEVDRLAEAVCDLQRVAA